MCIKLCTRRRIFPLGSAVKNTDFCVSFHSVLTSYCLNEKVEQVDRVPVLLSNSVKLGDFFSTLKLLRRNRGNCTFRGEMHTCGETLMILYICVCTCCVAHSSCRCCEFDGPTFQGETASELAPSSHRHPWANEKNYVPSLGLHQAAQCRQTHAYCRETIRKRLAHILNYYPCKHPSFPR